MRETMPDRRDGRCSFRAVIFDLDGTITKPYLSFNDIREEMGDVDGPILEAMDRMTPKERSRCESILLRHERAAAEASELNHGAAELLDELRDRNLSVALLTRNSRRSVETVLQRHRLENAFDAIRSREEGEIKPSPEPVISLCQMMGVAPARTLVVGDYAYDILSGQRAGARTALIHHGEPPDFADQADWVIDRLDLVLDILEGKP
jgi:HAD superfamily hydrolase (TIGR01509 family)